MENDRHYIMTQRYSSWGNKLLGHADFLCNIQKDKVFTPITIQLGPCEICDSDCPLEI